MNAIHPTNAATIEFLKSPRPMLIGADWTMAASGEMRSVLDPATGSEIATVAEGGVEDLNRAVKAARAAFQSRTWRRMPPAERSQLMWRLADLIEANGEELVQMEVLNQGLPIALASEFVIPGVSETLRYYGGWCTKLEGMTSSLSIPDERGEGAFGPAWHAYTNREPIGVVGAIVPWNFPLIMAVAKLAPAITAGCTLVLKPAEETPLSTLRLAELTLEAGFPPGVINIVTGAGETVGAAMAAHPEIDKIAFTGSTETGRKIAQAATSNMKKVSLELGGKAPIVIMADADLEQAIPAAAEGVLMNSGQICFASTRLLVEEPVFEDVCSGVADIMKSTKLGPGLDPSSEVGPLISARQHDRVMSFFSDDSLMGIELRTGGNAWGDTGYFIEPTLAVSKETDTRFLREEIFGPVLTALPVNRNQNLSSVVQSSNDTPYGLAASIWTKDLSTAHVLAAEIQAGVVFVNCHSALDESMPFGGFKESGWGREGNVEGIHEYMETKSVVVSL